MVHEVSSLASTTAGHFDLGEVRCLIASAEVSGWVSEGLDHHHRIAPAGLKVRREPLQCCAENLANEVRASVFIKDAEPLVVGDVAQPAVALLVAPGKEILARAYVQGSRAETQECAPPLVLYRNAAHDLAETSPAPSQCEVSRVASKRSRSPTVIGRTTSGCNPVLLADSIPIPNLYHNRDRARQYCCIRAGQGVISGLCRALG